MKTKIGILGSGIVAKTLAQGFIQHGYAVKLGTAHPEKLQDLPLTEKLSVGSFSEAAAFGEILVLAVKGSAALSVFKSLEPSLWQGKTVIDTTNPIADEPAVNNVFSFFSSYNKSLLETLQEAFPEARFVKSFSSIGTGLMINPSFGDTKPSMFICGNDAQAKKEVAEITELFGFEAEDLGKQEAARAIEPLCILWCIEGLATNVWDRHALKLIRKA